MRKTPADGFRSLVGTQAKVVSKSETGHSAKYLVRAQGEGELWSAYSTDVLDIGEPVNIVAVKGIGLVVERTENGSRSGKADDVKAGPFGAKDNRRHCH